MGKISKASKTSTVRGLRAATKLVRNAETGQVVTVMGVGALEGSDLKIKKGVNLLKPIAEQVFARRSAKTKAG